MINLREEILECLGSASNLREFNRNQSPEEGEDTKEVCRQLEELNCYMRIQTLLHVTAFEQIEKAKHTALVEVIKGRGEKHGQN